MEKGHRFVGTIIDKSYYDLYDGIFKDQAARYKMCEMCDTPRVLLIGSGKEKELARGRYHHCEDLDDPYKYILAKWDDTHSFRFISPEKK